MSLRRCIPELFGANKLSRDQADRAQGLFDELERDYSSKMSPAMAEALASEETVKRLELDAALKRRQSLQQLKAQQNIAADIRAYDGDDPGAAAVALFTNDSRAPYWNVERRADVIEGQAHAMLAGILERHSRNALGQVRDQAGLVNVIREAFGEHTGDLAAKELADAWGQAADMLRLRFNAAGGAIGKLENWGMPQVHDMLAVRSVGFETWRDFIRPLLEASRMKDQTGNRLTAQQLELALRGVYESISTEGWIDRKPGSFAGRGKLANRRAESRFLIFRDATAWLEYSNRFGRPASAVAEWVDPEGPIFDAMMGHIKSMAGDIALMERLGPNPAATVRWLTDNLQKEAMLPKHGPRRLEAAKQNARVVDDLYRELAGLNRGLDNRRARIFNAVRSWQTAAKLGSAALSAVSDVGFQHVTRKFNGLSAVTTLNDYVRFLKPSARADRELALRLWLTAGEMGKLARSQNRFTNEMVTGQLADRLAEGVMRVSGLSAWTQAGRWGFGREFWSHITDQTRLRWSGLNAPFRRQLQRYGFTQADWEAIRSTPLEDVNGAPWLLPENIERRDLAERVAEMIATETDYAVPTASIRVTSAINSRLERGTWIGEIIRSALLFKSFPLTVFWMHGRRMIEQQPFDRLRYGANLFISTTLMGAVAWQLKQIAAGKDPQPTDDPDFWLQAMAQGGGLGIMGDFVKSATSRFDQDIYSTLAGPVASTVVEAKRVLTGKNRERALHRLIQSNLPGSTIWYTKLAFQREVMDELQSQIDPDYYDAFARMERRAAEDNAAYWWRPGEPAPERAPDLANGARQQR